MSKEPKSDYMRYAYGFSDKKPGASFWVIIAAMALFDLWAIFGGVQ